MDNPPYRTSLQGLIVLTLLVRVWSRVVTSRMSLDGNHPSSRLDSEGEDEEEDARKVRSHHNAVLVAGKRASGKFWDMTATLIVKLYCCD